MSLWIKICGNTSLEDTLLAAEAGASAVGFVFAPSPRRLTSGQAAVIVPHLPAQLEKIGVFVDATLEDIAATVEIVGLTGVQLHFAAEPTMPIQLRDRFGPSLRILQVVHFDPAAGAPAVLPGVDGILVDSRTAVAVGGTGKTFDWHAAAGTLFENARGRKLIAAGGLTPANVAEAVALLRPWGVDVVSGVEASPGRKDAAKVRAFVATALSLQV